MGCAAGDDHEDSDKFSNHTLEEPGAMGEGDALHSSHLLGKDWFVKYAGDPNKLFAELATGEGKTAYISKGKSSLVANSLMVLGVNAVMPDEGGSFLMRFGVNELSFSDKAMKVVEDKVRLRKTEAVEARAAAATVNSLV